jgi:arylsulfatase A-like enzyme
MAPDMSDDERAFLSDRYDEEIRFTDDAIGRLFAKLDELGLADDTLVVFTADHGEELAGRGWIGHTQSLYRELVRVPLVMRGRDIAAGARIDAPVSLVALAPTVLELLGVAATRPTDALPFVDLLRGEVTTGPPVFCEVDYLGVEPGKPGVPTCHKKAVVRERLKLIRDDLAGETELYDLVEDPGELRSLAEERPETVRELSALLDRHLAALRRIAPENERAEYNEDELRELQELGYVGYD